MLIFLLYICSKMKKLQNLKIMKISFPDRLKERAFKQLYEDYYAPFCLYAKDL